MQSPFTPIKTEDLPDLQYPPSPTPVKLEPMPELTYPCTLEPTMEHSSPSLSPTTTTVDSPISSDITGFDPAHKDFVAPADETFEQLFEFIRFPSESPRENLDVFDSHTTPPDDHSFSLDSIPNRSSVRALRTVPLSEFRDFLGVHAPAVESTQDSSYSNTFGMRPQDQDSDFLSLY
jgi:hypothetical protein